MLALSSLRPLVQIETEQEKNKNSDLVAVI